MLQKTCPRDLTCRPCCFEFTRLLGDFPATVDLLREIKELDRRAAVLSDQLRSDLAFFQAHGTGTRERRIDAAPPVTTRRSLSEDPNSEYRGGPDGNRVTGVWLSYGGFQYGYRSGARAKIRLMNRRGPRAGRGVNRVGNALAVQETELTPLQQTPAPRETSPALYDNSGRRPDAGGRARLRTP